MENNGGGRVLNIKIIYLYLQVSSPKILTQEYLNTLKIYKVLLKNNKISKQNNTYSSEVYSIGHRNPQGLFVSNKFNKIYSTEHGPQGGDELNLILKGKTMVGHVYLMVLNTVILLKDSEIWPSKENLKNRL